MQPRDSCVSLSRTQLKNALMTWLKPGNADTDAPL